MPSACAQRGRPSEALGRTVSQSAGSEAFVANCSITPSSSTSVTFADCWESTLPTTIRTARTTRLKRRLRRSSSLCLAGNRRCYRGSQAAGPSASLPPLGCVEEWADRFWRATQLQRAGQPPLARRQQRAQLGGTGRVEAGVERQRPFAGGARLPQPALAVESPGESVLAVDVIADA